ncbi:hypothetical protein QI633_03565 [Nocardioides sp. QY071]|uniref:hypothetical protein n=1 Tax=Nocardioides sp. QY071 TaxID=3044187 RepID=UPI00249B451A|nr:hypothetical protein [Nocardioides sp. QY071]WGY02840.1 hypothetical protein QI633_03565 [Nocardioides sp. QY071]
MSSSSRLFRRHSEPTKVEKTRRRRHQLALLLPAVVVVSTVLSGPAYADDVNDPAPTTPDTAQSTPTPDPAPSADPKPDPKPEPTPDPKPEPSPDPKPEPKPSADPTPSDQPSEQSSGQSSDSGKPDEAKSSEDAAAQPEAATGQAPEQVKVPVANKAPSTSFAAAAAAVNTKKVVVCKYVSTPPGVLHHIVIPSVSSLPGFPGTFPWAFADAQISVAIRYANDGEQAKDVALSECPQQMPVPQVPVDDPCGPGNAVYGQVPAGNYMVVRNGDGSITLVANAGYLFFGGSPTATLPPPTETFTAPCPTPIPVPTVQWQDPCGPDNIHALSPVPSTQQYDGVIEADGSVTFTIKPGAGVTFPNGQTSVNVPKPADSGVACAQGEIPVPEIPATDPCGPNNAAYTLPLPTAPNGEWTAVLNPNGSVTITAGANTTFPGGDTEVTLPKPTDTNSAACPKKIVVCKYVSTPPGVLDHIIIVSVNAADWPDGTVFPTPFNDEQNSIAIRFAEPGEQAKDVDVAECPSEATVPNVPKVDPCGPDNATFGTVPQGPWTVTTNPDGSITLTATGNAWFPNMQKQVTIPAPTDSNIACIVVPPLDKKDPCGPNNATWVLPAETDEYSAAIVQGQIVLTAKDDYRFDGDATTYTYQVAATPTDSGTACLVAPAIASSDPCNPTGVTANASWVLPTETADYTVSVVNGVVTLIGKLGKVFDGDKPTYTYDLAATPPDSGVVCEVGGVEETSHQSTDEVDSAQAATGLPNTGGPVGWLMPLGVGLVLAGAGLVLGRRSRSA